MGILGYLQRIGRALMVPVATLPAAAILMGVGYWLDPIGMGQNSPVAAFLIQSGSAILNNMSLLFAIGVAYGMSKDKNGAAALAGYMGFLIVTTLCSPTAVSMIQSIPKDQVPLAFQNINNQFIGILVGVISAEIYNRFSHVELHKALSFFSGRRLIPILTSFAGIILSFILMLVWPVLFSLLLKFGIEIKSLGSFGAGLYAFFNRLLIPIGLHHALNSVFWFNVAGINDIPNFLGGQASINAGKAIVGITGRYQAGFFPIMMFGLPGAALAIYHCAKPENKNKVAGIMLAGALASFFTGVTEPLEFSFMFVAPPLYFIHAVLTGLSVYISAAMHWISGFGFSAGFVDLMLSARNPLAHDWYMLIPQGIAFFFIYYFIFRFTILKFNLKTPGREDNIDEGNQSGINLNSANQDTATLARRFVAAAGGSDNLVNIDACITRLRLTVKDSSLVNETAAKALGASGLIRLNKENVQIIVGPRAEIISDEMKQQCMQGKIDATPLDSTPLQTTAKSKPSIKSSKKHHSKKVCTLIAPVSGKVIPLSAVPDEAFSSKAVGDGIAIEPTSSQVLAPVTGQLVKIFNTNHAFCIISDEGAEIIVHIGLDTVNLNGQGFKRLATEGSSVTVGTPILELDLDYLKEHSFSLISPVVVSNIDDYSDLLIRASGKVEAGVTEIYTIES